MTKESLKISFSKKFRKRRNSSMKKFLNDRRSNLLSRSTKKSSERLFRPTMEKFSENWTTNSYEIYITIYLIKYNRVIILEY